MLKLARPWETDATTKELLESIRKRCDTCQRFSRPPVILKISLHTEETLIICGELSLDPMLLGCKAVLHIIDIATHFSVATFLAAHGTNYGHSSQFFWLSFIMTWVTMYNVYPD